MIKFGSNKSHECIIKQILKNVINTNACCSVCVAFITRQLYSCASFYKMFSIFKNRMYFLLNSFSQRTSFLMMSIRFHLHIAFVGIDSFNEVIDFLNEPGIQRYSRFINWYNELITDNHRKISSILLEAPNNEENKSLVDLEELTKRRFHDAKREILVDANGRIKRRESVARLILLRNEYMEQVAARYNF